MLFRARNLFSKTCLLQMYKSYAKPMISCGMLAYGSAKKNSAVFLFTKTHLKFFKKRGDHVFYLFKSYNVLSIFDFYFDALGSWIRLPKFLPNFLDVDSNRPNTRASIMSLIPLPKVKTHSEKILENFNHKIVQLPF